MRVFHFQHLGKRDNQEDSYYIHPEGKLFIVCDGVGGVEGGKTASSAVIKSLVRSYNKIAGACDEILVQWMIRTACEDLKALASAQKFSSEMGTTLAMLVIEGNSVFIAHIGDSRVYHIQPETHRWWATKDHSLVQELFDAGVLSNESEMRSHPMKSRITRAIQAGPDDVPEDIPVQVITHVAPGSVFILCTDGVLESFTNEGFAAHFMREELSVEGKWNELKAICEKQSLDNNTCIMVLDYH